VNYMEGEDRFGGCERIERGCINVHSSFPRSIVNSVNSIWKGAHGVEVAESRNGNEPWGWNRSAPLREGVWDIESRGDSH